MKFETLVTRYKNLGYTPQNLDKEIEIECIINWMYEKYDVFIYVTHLDYITQKSFRKHEPNIKSFHPSAVWYVNTDHSNAIYYEEYFNHPFDAKFYTVKELYKVLRHRIR
jgi:hypothetical protein